MGIFDFFRKNKKEDLPLIARVNLKELKEQREKERELKDVSILAAADYTKRIPTIRLYYIAIEKFKPYGTNYGTNEFKVGTTYGISSPFRLPNDMSIEDACKVVSYLSEAIERENDLEPGCERSVQMVSNVLSSMGFDKVEGKKHGYYHTVSEYSPMHRINCSITEIKNNDGVVDLFTVGGDFKLFKRSNLYADYFDWFTEGVTKEEVVDIYKKIRKDYLLPDSLISDEPQK